MQRHVVQKDAMHSGKSEERTDLLQGVRLEDHRHFGFLAFRGFERTADTVHSERGEVVVFYKDGIAEVADALPEAVGGPIAARIRGEIWGRSIDLVSSVPTGAAFVAAGLGFLTEDESVGVYEADGWVRLSTLHGHVLAKAAKTFNL
jgi:hypothetical protein